jgi:pimeloyl-ACP methyl ester carboxylesterase
LALGTPASPPALERVACTELGFAAADLAGHVECAWFSVPESRGRARSRTLRLAVVIARATGPSAAPDPVLYLHGGPGIATLDVVPRALRGQSWPRLRVRRDLVFFDQRGTGRSRPLLCPAFNAALGELDANPLGPEAGTAARLAAARRCGETMAAEGGDPTAYNSTAIAADAEALRRALGYSSWNLFATSFGTLPAFELARRHPRSVRALLLDSAFPPNSGNRVEQISATAASLAAVQRRCDASPACRQTYGAIRPLAARVVARLNAAPLTMATGRVNGEAFMRALWTMLVFGNTVPHVPELLRRAAAGDDALVRRIVAAFGGSDSFGGYSHTQSWLVNCHDIFPRRSAAVFARALAAHRDIAGADDPARTDRVCWAIQPGRAPAGFYRSERLSVPALVYFGEFDPATPRADAEAAMRMLGRGTLIDVAGASHAPFYTDDCTRTIALAFFDAPAARPDLSCLGARAPFAFSEAGAFDRFVASLPE